MDRQTCPSTKVERRIVERNRRNHMKDLYSKLYSLLPNSNPQEALPLPDQVDEAIKYIKSLEEKVKVAKEKKESLSVGSSRKRSRGGCTKSPKIEVHEKGSSLQVVMTCGIDSQFMFVEIIRILHEQGINVVSANSSLAGDSMRNVVHAQIPPSFYEFRATKVSERLKRFVNGCASDVETEAGLWDFEMGSGTWELPELFGFPNPL